MAKNTGRMSKAASEVKADIETLVWMILNGYVDVQRIKKVFHCWRCQRDIIPTAEIEFMCEIGAKRDELSAPEIIRLSKYFNRKT